MRIAAPYWAFISLLLGWGAFGQAESLLVVNEDNSHFYTTRTADDMTLDGLNAFVDQYANTAVTHLFLSPNSMRASFASTTRGAIWQNEGRTPPEPTLALWADNAKLLHDRGLDPYAVWIARAREKGISPWLSMRMNDLHSVDEPLNIMHSQFWIDHPELRRVPGATTGGWTDMALDYGHPEVCEHAMSFIKELLERYDPDGLELDWMRFGWHFKAGEEAEGVRILNVFMAETRALTMAWSAKRGHPIHLAARVPADPDAAKGLGMDGVRWAKEGLVDMLVPCPFWTTSDFDIPVEEWQKRIGDAPVQILPGLEFNTRGYPGGPAVANDLASTYGFAAGAWVRGADGIYLFNYMDSGTIPVSQSDYRILVEQGLAADAVAPHVRRYIRAYRDTVPSGFPNGAQLPIDLSSGGEVTIYVGPKPTAGRVIFVIGLAETSDATLSVAMNGTACDALTTTTDVANYAGVAQAHEFTCPLEALHDGHNTFTIAPISNAQTRIVWAEVRVEP